MSNQYGGPPQYGGPTMLPGGPGQPPGTQVTWPPGLSASALLEPPSTQLRAQQGVYFYRPHVPVDRPRPWFPADPNIGRQVRRVVRNFSGLTAGTEVPQNIQVDTPATVYALTGAAFNTAAGLSAGLDSFRVRFEYITGDRLDTVSGLGSALLGTAAFPAFIGDVGWSFDRGSAIRVFVTPLIANLAIDIAVWWIEVRGPVNFSMT